MTASDQPAPSLTVVIPAYNEASRIAETVRQVIAFLAIQPFPTDLLVVDDGSTDTTARTARRAMEGSPVPASVIEIPHGGKAAALRAGMITATGQQVLFTDADLATPLRHLDDLRAAIARGCDVAIGSREGTGAQRVGEPEYRHLMGRAFNALVRSLLLPGIDDTQCGFKLFTQDALRAILPRTRLYRDTPELTGARVTAYDVELLVIAQRLGYRICSVPVTWVYGAGSKVRPLADSWHNAQDVLSVWRNAKRGLYR
ncbi:MAG: dolichyl-phosphate beta-glucosyltransferase [Chloroflexota bacterium]